MQQASARPIHVILLIYGSLSLPLEKRELSSSALCGGGWQANWDLANSDLANSDSANSDLG